MRIKVTQKHIKKGKVASCGECPVALAIKERLQSNDVAVFISSVNINVLPYILTQKAARFVKDFDKGKRVRPFSFNLSC